MELNEGMQDQSVTPQASSDTQEAKPEKVLKQSEVNELVGRIKHEAYSKGQRDALANTQQQTQSMGGMQGMSSEQVRQLISEEAQKQTHQASAMKVAQDFVAKMESGKGKHDDFEQTVAELDLKSIPHIVQLATGMDNTADIMYELGRNPSKVATLTTLAYVNPRLAQIEMQKLSKSIKDNEAGENAPSSNEPLSQIRPSTIGKDNGSNTIRDLRKKAWARG